MKKMYNKPQIDVTVVNTANMLMDITVSTNSGGGGGGTAHAPASGGEVID